MRVLIVDDESVVLQLLRRYLEGWGHEVVTAGDGLEALRLFEQDPTPMVITDWMMPGCNGLELIRRIRAHPRGAHVYALLLTARAAKEDVVAGMESGADDFLAKPFDKDELRVRVREGERIVELERARSRAEERCEHMRSLIAHCLQCAEQDLDYAVQLLGTLEGGSADSCREALSHLSSVQTLVASLRSDTEKVAGRA